MKGIIRVFLCAALFLPAIVLTSCAGTAPAQENGAAVGAAHENGTEFGAVEGREWMLLELRRAAEVVVIDREADLFGMGAIYTATFEGGRISGMGAPNRFFGPYTAGANRALSIGSADGAMAATLMMPLVEPEFLREHEYFAYLSRVTRWNLSGGNLELFSTSEDGSETILVFVPK